MILFQHCLLSEQHCDAQLFALQALLAAPWPAALLQHPYTCVHTVASLTGSPYSLGADGEECSSNDCILATGVKAVP